jgi:MOSC domain-containing protein YiiM
MTAQLIAIFRAAEAEAPMELVAEGQLEAGRGLVGDRYHSGNGTFSDELKGKPDVELTLIESEQIDRFNDAQQLDLDYGSARRNLVTKGVDLNALVGARFSVGEVTLEGVRLCEPCAHMARIVAKQVLPALVHRAGLRAKVVTSGTIRPGDEVTRED